ncbi:WD40 repeat-like protein [Obba rivulosa]|uniref:WD40 repeat-like protein n=1 Tax=Obba rivulosa TaxID=1052685 RepID=A0A8E2ALQ3_9APHY|nr:WD40 repeat-like protein [Obba rivulosa]
MSDEFHAHKVYAEQLRYLGYGMPLWHPEPTVSEEVEIGDVGYFHRGGFYRLFNATRPADDPIQRYGCPGDEQYQPFQPNTVAPYTSRGEFPAGLTLYSKNMTKIDVGAQGGIATANGGFSFSYTGGKGAILVLQDAAAGTEVHNGRRMENYMRQNYEAWYEFAREKYGRDLQRDDIVFMRGWVKTTQWAVAAFAEGGVSGSLMFNLGLPMASASLNVSGSHNVSASHLYRIGPERESQATVGADHLIAAGPSSQPPIAAMPKADQCIFMMYYKIKPRRFSRWRGVDIRAAAEPRDLPGPPDDGSSPPGAAIPSAYQTPDSMEVESVPGLSRVNDPVDDILDYILRNSNAEVAIAHDGQVTALCAKLGVELPEDLSGTLQSALPSIEVTEDGLGILAPEPSGARSAGAARPVSEDPEAGPSQDGSSGDVLHSAIITHMELHLQEHEGSVVSCDISPDGRYIATGSEDASVRIWDARTGDRLHTITRGTGAIADMMFHPSRPELLVASEDGSVFVLNVENGGIRPVLEEHEGDVCSAAFSPDGRLIASVSDDFAISIWHADTGDQLAVLREHKAVVVCLAFSTDSSQLVSGSGDHIACVWNVMDGQKAATLREQEGVIVCAAFSPDGSRVITGSDSGVTRIWKANTGEELVMLEEHAGSINFVAFFPDGQRVISASDDGIIKVSGSWEGENIYVLDDTEHTVTSLAISLDGTRICAGVGNNSVKLWRADSGELTKEFVGHSDRVNRVRFSASAERIVSASDDRTVCVWGV